VSINSFKESANGRLTSDWTKTVEEAYGSSGKLGRKGEQWLANLLRGRGYEVIDYEESHRHQLQGIDLSIKNTDTSKQFTLDVKTNIKNDGTFFIEISETGWLLTDTKISDLIWHVNTFTGDIAWYTRAKMKHFVLSKLNNLDDEFKKMIRGQNLLMLNINNLSDELSFIKTKRNFNTKII
jgi:hypothetical protein